MSHQTNTIAKKIHGSGQPVILLHGFAHSHKYWNKVVRHMPHDKFHIITPDSIGFGMSDKPTELNYDIDDHSEELAKALFKDVSQPVILVGHSMGAMIALRIAKHHPDLVQKLILINPPLFTSPEHAKRVIMSKLPLLYRAYIGRLGIVIHSMRDSWLMDFLHATLLAKNPDLRDIVTDYLSHTRRSFIYTLRNTIFAYSMYDDLQGLKIITKYIYCPTAPFYDPASLAFFSKYPNMQAVEISGGHKIPYVNAEQVVHEICA